MPNSRAFAATEPVILEPIAPPLILDTVASIMETLACPPIEYNKESNRILPVRILLVNMQEREDLSALVQRRIRELGLSNSEVARRAKLSRSYIGNIVNRTAPTQSGQYNLSPEAAHNLAAAIEVSDIEFLSAMKYLAGESFADTLTKDTRIKHLLGSVPEDEQPEVLEEVVRILEYVTAQRKK